MDEIQTAVHAEMSKLVDRLRNTMTDGITVDRWFTDALDWYLEQ